jgi:hypothetical protein
VEVPRDIEGAGHRTTAGGLYAVVAGAVAAGLFLVAYNEGGFGLAARGIVAIAVWWALLLGVALGPLPLARVPRAAVAGGALLAAFAAFTLLSAAWAPGAAGAVTEANRVVLHLGLFLLGALASSWRTISAWSDGLAAGLVAVALVALAARFFHGLFGDQGLPEFLPAAAARLSFPVGYWNGLAILVALAVPLLLRIATTASRPVVRGLAVAPVPAVAAVAVLASSRGGLATGAVGAVAFLALSRRRWAALGALVCAGAGSAAAIAVLLRYDDLVDGPLGTAAADEQGLNAAFLLTGISLLTGGAYAVLAALPPVRLPAAVGWATAGVLAAVAIAGVAAADPGQRFAEFREPPPEGPVQQDGFTREHLASAAGSSRWQFWEAGIEQWRTAPVRGRGAGSYEAWWVRHGTTSQVARDAHSLYVETLGELGLVGFLLVVAALAAPLVAAGDRLRRMRPGDGESLAALAAVGLAFLAALGLDWMWELPVVAGLGLLCLGLLAGPGTLPRPEHPWEEVDASEPRFALGTALIVGAWVAIVLQALPLLGELQLRRSQEAAGRGDVSVAFEHARSARSLEPWSPRPRLQLALLEEQAGELPAARAALEEAIERAPEDWRLWLIAARLETRLGRIDEARAALARARELNPRSPLFRREEVAAD